MHLSIYISGPSLYFMRMNSRFLLLFLAFAFACSVPACKSVDDSEYYYKLKNKNERYKDKSSRRKARIQARQERTDMWFDSIMN